MRMAGRNDTADSQRESLKVCGVLLNGALPPICNLDRVSTW
jgi:hypothetical protein